MKSRSLDGKAKPVGADQAGRVRPTALLPLGGSRSAPLPLQTLFRFGLPVRRPALLNLAVRPFALNVAAAGFDSAADRGDPARIAQVQADVPRRKVAEEQRSRSEELQRCFDRLGDFDDDRGR